MQEVIGRRVDYLKTGLSELKSKIDKLLGEKDLLSSQVQDYETKIKDLKDGIEVIEKAIEVLDLAQREITNEMKEGFESIVTYALQYILGEDYSFKLEFGRHGALQEMNFNIISPSLDSPADPLDTAGGGALDIVSLALRVSILELHKPKIQGPIILDESFKHLSRQYLESAGRFLKAISEKIGRQIIIITHKNELVQIADNSVKLG